jgi:general stress protein 26
MKRYNRNTNTRLISFFIFIFLIPLGALAQEKESKTYDPDTLLAATKELMSVARYCALITLDQSGHPNVRMMDPFPAEDDLVVWFGTNKYSRKVQEIRDDSRVTLYYQLPGAGGYAVIRGEASLVDDPKKIERYWKKEWEQFYPDRKDTYLLVKVIPKQLEIIDYKHQIAGESNTWTVPSLELKE